ncbi:beta-lactamase 2-like [Thraustotheca clavata]|uniref:Beta-lactamase 2-like n=1 Tax=Thraustotheca clavata TaxID=74557 RepID=A0A1V9YSP1_9STRA|nr:beta-lactamase 2-like [Thraustotheca clavata]
MLNMNELWRQLAGGIAIVTLALWLKRDSMKKLLHNSHSFVKIRARATAWLVAFSGTSNSLTNLPIVEKLDSNVLRVLGLNPGRMTLQGTNTYVVGTGASRILIDTGDGSKKYLNTLLVALQAHQVDTISDIVLTHGHFDHIGGLWQLQKQFPKARVWKMLTYVDSPTKCECSSHVSNAYSIDEFQMCDLNELIVTGKALETEGASLKPIYTPGHTNDHVCFLLDDSSIFTGDCVLGEGTCTFQSLQEYMNSLRKIRGMNPTCLYPGHGPVVKNACETIDMYLKHRQQREDEILNVLRSTPTASVREIVTKIYPKLPYMLQIAAGRNVSMHLKKLLDDKVVTIAQSTYFGGTQYKLVL